MSQLRLFLLGVPEVHLDGQPIHLRTHKALALLAYLAMQPGPHSRETLADLLWTDLPGTARAALRVTLYQLRTALDRSGALNVTRSSVNLRGEESLWVDALELEERAGEQCHPLEPASLPLWRGEFLQGLSVRRAPTWDDWVSTQTLLQQERFDALLARLTAAQLAAGQVWNAIATARRRVTHSPLSEDAYLQLSRAQRAAGLHAEAHRSERRGREVLLEELGLEPEWDGPAPTSAVWESRPATPRSGAGQVPDQTAYHELPLIGRETLLRQMAEAWERRQVIFLTGEAGLGKTRLAHAFIARHGLQTLNVEGRVLDASVPFALAARLIRVAAQALARPHLPELSDTLRRELSRLVPELWLQAAPLLDPSTARLRLYDSFMALLESTQKAGLYFLLENLHLWDDESQRMAAHAAIYGPERDVYVHSVGTYRPGALPASMLSPILLGVEKGRGVVLDVPPLSTEQVHEALAHLEPRATSALAERLTHFTGGNPLFVLETARLLQAQGGLFNPDYRDLPRPPRISEVIGQRLARLSQGGLDLARVAAHAGPAFSFEVAARVLACNDLDIAAAFGELGAAGLFRGERFAHDLLETTAHDLTPEPVRTALHRRLLDALQSTHPAAVRVGHALGGQRWAEAHRLLMRASQDAHAVLALEDAERFAAQARALLTQHGGPLPDTVFDG